MTTDQFRVTEQPFSPRQPQTNTGLSQPSSDQTVGDVNPYNVNVVKELVRRNRPDVAQSRYPTEYKALFGDQQTQPNKVKIYNAASEQTSEIEIDPALAHKYNTTAWGGGAPRFDVGTVKQFKLDDKWANQVTRRVDYNQIGGINGTESKNGYKLFDKEALLPNLFAQRLGMLPEQVLALNHYDREEVSKQLLLDYYNAAPAQEKQLIGDPNLWVDKVLNTYGFDEKGALDDKWTTTLGNTAGRVFDGAIDQVGNWITGAKTLVNGYQPSEDEKGDIKARHAELEAKRTPAERAAVQRVESLIADDRWEDALLFATTNSEAWTALLGTSVGSLIADAMATTGLIYTGSAIVSAATGGTGAAVAGPAAVAATAANVGRLANKLRAMVKAGTMGTISSLGMVGQTAKDLVLDGKNIPPGSDLHKQLALYGAINIPLSVVGGSLESGLFNVILKKFGPKVAQEVAPTLANRVQSELVKKGYTFTKDGVTRSKRGKAIEWGVQPLTKVGVETGQEWVQGAYGDALKQGSDKDGNFNWGNVDVGQAFENTKMDALGGTLFGIGHAGASTGLAKLRRGKELALGKQAHDFNQFQAEMSEDAKAEMESNIANGMYRIDGTLRQEGDPDLPTDPELRKIYDDQVRQAVLWRKFTGAEPEASTAQPDDSTDTNVEDDPVDQPTPDQPVSQADIDAAYARKKSDRTARISAWLHRDRGLGDIYADESVVKDIRGLSPHNVDQDWADVRKKLEGVANNLEKQTTKLQEEVAKAERRATAMANALPELSAEAQQKLAEAQQNLANAQDSYITIRSDLLRAKTSTDVATLIEKHMAHLDGKVAEKADRLRSLAAQATPYTQSKDGLKRFNDIERQTVAGLATEIAQEVNLPSLAVQLDDLVNGLDNLYKQMVILPTADSKTMQQQIAKVKALQAIVKTNRPEMLANWRNIDKVVGKIKGKQNVLWANKPVQYGWANKAVGQTIKSAVVGRENVFTENTRSAIKATMDDLYESNPLEALAKVRSLMQQELEALDIDPAVPVESDYRRTMIGAIQGINNIYDRVSSNDDSTNPPKSSAMYDRVKIGNKWYDTLASKMSYTEANRYAVDVDAITKAYNLQPTAVGVGFETDMLGYVQALRNAISNGPLPLKTNARSNSTLMGDVTRYDEKNGNENAKKAAIEYLTLVEKRLSALQQNDTDTVPQADLLSVENGDYLQAILEDTLNPNKKEATAVNDFIRRKKAEIVDPADGITQEQADNLEAVARGEQPPVIKESTVGIVVGAERAFTILHINGVDVPFYYSSGYGGKNDVQAGRWYPFFGFGSSTLPNWIRKTGGKPVSITDSHGVTVTIPSMNDGYGSAALRAGMEYLNNKYDEQTTKGMIDKKMNHHMQTHNSNLKIPPMFIEIVNRDLGDSVNDDIHVQIFKMAKNNKNLWTDREFAAMTGGLDNNTVSNNETTAYHPIVVYEPKTDRDRREARLRQREWEKRERDKPKDGEYIIDSTSPLITNSQGKITNKPKMVVHNIRGSDPLKRAQEYHKANSSQRFADEGQVGSPYPLRPRDEFLAQPEEQNVVDKVNTLPVPYVPQTKQDRFDQFRRRADARRPNPLREGAQALDPRQPIQVGPDGKVHARERTVVHNTPGTDPMQRAKDLQSQVGDRPYVMTQAEVESQLADHYKDMFGTQGNEYYMVSDEGPVLFTPTLLTELWADARTNAPRKTPDGYIEYIHRRLRLLQNKYPEMMNDTVRIAVRHALSNTALVDKLVKGNVEIGNKLKTELVGELNNTILRLQLTQNQNIESYKTLIAAMAKNYHDNGREYMTFFLNEQLNTLDGITIQLVDQTDAVLNNESMVIKGDVIIVDSTHPDLGGLMARGIALRGLQQWATKTLDVQSKLDSKEMDTFNKRKRSLLDKLSREYRNNDKDDNTKHVTFLVKEGVVRIENDQAVFTQDGLNTLINDGLTHGTWSQRFNRQTGAEIVSAERLAKRFALQELLTPTGAQSVETVATSLVKNLTGRVTAKATDIDSAAGKASPVLTGFDSPKAPTNASIGDIDNTIPKTDGLEVARRTLNELGIDLHDVVFQDGKVDGFAQGTYHGETGQISIDQNGPTVVETTIHETGHRAQAKRNAKLGMNRYLGDMHRIAQHPFVQRLLKSEKSQQYANHEDYKNRDEEYGEGMTLAGLVEEIVVDLYAAKRSGNWEYFAKRYGIKVSDIPAEIRGLEQPSIIRQFIQAVKNFIKVVFGREEDVPTSTITKHLDALVAADETFKGNTHIPAGGHKINNRSFGDNNPNPDNKKDRVTTYTFGYHPDNQYVSDVPHAWWDGNGWNFFYVDAQGEPHRLVGLTASDVLATAQDLDLFVTQRQKDLVLKTAPETTDVFQQFSPPMAKFWRGINRVFRGDDENINPIVRSMMGIVQKIAIEQHGADQFLKMAENVLTHVTGTDKEGSLTTLVNRYRTRINHQLNNPGIAGAMTMFDHKEALLEKLRAIGWSEDKVNNTLYAMRAADVQRDLTLRQTEDPKWKGKPLEVGHDFTAFSWTTPDGKVQSDPDGTLWMASLSDTDRKIAEDLRNLVTALNDSVLRIEYEFGRISEDTFNEQVGKFYVPLKNEDDKATAFQRRSVGRYTKADDPLTHLLANHEARLRAAEQSRIYQAFMDAVEQYGLTGFATFNSSTLTNKGDGEYAMTADGFLEGNAVTFYRNGKKVRMVITHPAMKKALAKRSKQAQSAYLDTVAKLTGFLGLTRTGLPTFAKTAFFRDMGLSMINTEAAFRGKEKSFSTADWAVLGARTATRMVKSVFMIARAKWDNKNGDFTYKVYRSEGGIGTTTAYDIDSVNAALERDVFDQTSAKSRVKGFGRKYLNALHASDDAARYALWISYLEKKNGGAFASEQDLVNFLKDNKEIADLARNASKNITGNFEQRGMDRSIRSHYIFWNAAMAGSRTFYGLLNPKYGTYGIKAMSLLMAIAFFTAAGGDDDEDGKNKESRVKNLGNAITIGGFDFGLAQELRPVYHLGQALAFSMDGTWTVSQAMNHVLNGLSQAVVPAGPAQTGDAQTDLLYAITPTLLQPMVLQNAGKTYYGSDNAPVPYDTDGNQWQDAPDYLRAQRNSTGMSKAVTEALYNITGGHIDVAPGSVDMWAQQFFGSVFSHAKDIAKRVNEGEDYATAVVQQLAKSHNHEYNEFALKEEVNDRFERAFTKNRIGEDGQILGKSQFTDKYNELKDLKSDMDAELKQFVGDDGAKITDLYTQLNNVRSSSSYTPDEFYRLTSQIDRIDNDRKAVYGKYNRILMEMGY